LPLGNQSLEASLQPLPLGLASAMAEDGLRAAGDFPELIESLKLQEHSETELPDEIPRELPGLNPWMLSQEFCSLPDGLQERCGAGVPRH